MAEVSGPGEQSKRTDLGVLKQSTKPIQETQPMQSYTGGEYGNNKSMAMQQAAAPLAGSPTPAMPTMPMPEMPPMVGLDAPTQFPDEPLSYGANYGEGPGLDISGVRGMGQPTIREAVYRAIQFDPSGELEAIYNRLNQ
jgi:hypothetical protein